MKRLLLIITMVVLVISACAPATSGNEGVAEGTSHQVITVNQLKTMMKNKDFLLVNVHVPYVGEITGTDLFLPYNEIEQNLGKLPDDKGTKIVVYCQAGMMSNIAAKTLGRLGYTDIVDVDGGMIAWQKAGYQIIQKPH
ncbi:MAG: rhodanese-like domain-containing protein [Chloroflexi bacterium]|nr:rhodanese-like domain-containing protein [Chloroflexota bacterium]